MVTRRRIESFRADVTGFCELLDVSSCRDLNTDPLIEPLVLLMPDLSI